MRYLKNDLGPIWEYEVRTFENLRDLLENKIDNINDYVFRGQSDSEWQLTSTLDRLIRHARQTRAKQSSIDQFVKKHIDRFRLEIRGRRGDNPSKLEEDQLWALGQHYGLATPLLDWSQSPYISIFFALASLDNNGAQRVLWCLNRKQVESINNGLRDKNEKLNLIFPDSDDNKRLLGQSGLFSKGPVMKHVDKWVQQKSRNSNRPVLLKVIFPGDSNFRKSALKKLQLMNITHSTLFPDIAGASLYCNIIAEDYEV